MHYTQFFEYRAGDWIQRLTRPSTPYTSYITIANLPERYQRAAIEFQLEYE